MMNWDNADTDNGTKAILIQKEAQRERQREESRRILEAFEGGGGATEEEAAKFDKQLALLSNGATPTILAFDPFREHHLIVADLRNRISVWDWQANTKASFFVNGNPERISHVCMLSPVEASPSHLVVASSDGVVRVWGDYDDTNNGAGHHTSNNSHHHHHHHHHRLVGIHQMAIGNGFEADWSELDGICYGIVASDHSRSSTSQLLTWDIRRQGNLLLPTIPLKFGSTCIRASRINPKSVYIGYSDGVITHQDLRSPNNHSRQQVQVHQGRPVTSIYECGGGASNLIVSGTASGEISIYDPRWIGDVPLVTRFNLLDPEQHQQQDDHPHHIHHLTTFSAHPFLPVIAIGSGEPCLRFISVSSSSAAAAPSSSKEARIVNSIKYREGLFGQRIGTPLASAFHPRRPLYAAATNDSIISVYKC